MLFQKKLHTFWIYLSWMCLILILTLHADDIETLQSHSMLYEAKQLAKIYSGKKIQWHSPYRKTHPQEVVEKASTWFSSYGPATITCGKESYFRFLENEKLWGYLEDLGVDAIHIGPIKATGEIKNNRVCLSKYAYFDPISFQIDTHFGSYEDYLSFTQKARAMSTLVIGDTISGHTGRGYDFLLALKNYCDYPGLYHMIEIEKRDWHLLPQVKNNRLSCNLSSKEKQNLCRKGYITGYLEKAFIHKKTNWDATRKIQGVDGKERRWIYLHHLKENQPVLNWLDPSFSAQLLLAGDIIDSFHRLNQHILRIDVTSYLRKEATSHPIAMATTDLLGIWTRKLGGYSFQELNLSLDNIKAFTQFGADLSYDFLARTASYFSLLMQNADLLRLVYRELLALQLQPIGFIHALQNENELNFELLHFLENNDKMYFFFGKELMGQELRRDLIKKAYRKLSVCDFQTTEKGPQITIASLCAAALNIEDIYHMDLSEKQEVEKAHLLLASFNALQPGVFAFSGWDLVGALPLEKTQCNDTLKANRTPYDLLGCDCDSKYNLLALYGSLPSQKKKQNSFFSKLKKILKTRRDYHLHLGELINVPNVKNPEVFLLVHQLAGNQYIQLTALNFSQKTIEETLVLDEIQNTNALNLANRKTEEKNPCSNEFTFKLQPFEAKAILFEPFRR